MAHGCPMLPQRCDRVVFPTTLLSNEWLACESMQLRRRREYGAISSSEFDEVVVGGREHAPLL
jgi:hypothetical protein